ncbi:putative inner membrane protein [Vibrio mediterranei]|uniref:AI-2E family transporter n=1 Tax=Vibrio mediterranei TaxID=689 RepID=A0ABX5D503_9VIBR|nr:AI-2E family transporter [Vibrio mediterranei]PCD86426.1 AI-2E family transporter [Vibrio mediterranei]PRQ64753.1 AI-2E family transporter [Vibrio mediterranei]PTC04242.1 AI-2E family transporter [Vibrio mediterranei]SBO11591.1 putative inner membrane protein [Vibrio mediterranei]
MNFDSSFNKNAIDTFIKIATISILVYWCFSILRPFMMLVVWGGIIAVALYPVALWLHAKCRISKGKASGLLSLLGVLLLLIPLVWLSSGLYTGGTEVYSQLQDGTLQVPRPTQAVKELPVVGEKIYAAMYHASTNLEGAMAKYSEQIKSLATTLAGAVGSFAGGLLQFIVSTIIAGVFMANAENCQKAFNKVANRLTNGKGAELVNLSKSTVRSVVQGVLGVAVIQSIMAAVGMAFVDVPAIGLWALAVLLMAIIQLPPILALIPVIAYVFGTQSTTAAVLFLVWCVIVSGSDAVLKPMLLSRGSDIPMLVLLLGALGGMAMSGIVGLFVGAVVLSLSYQLFVSWLEEPEKAKD